MSGPIVTGRPVAPGRQKRLLPPARYRHPGDVIRLLAAGVVFAVTAAATLATHGTYAGASTTAVTVLQLSTTAGRVLTGLMTAAFAIAVVAVIAATLRYRRFRLLASMAGGALLTGAVLIGIAGLAGGERPQALAAGSSQWPWLIGPALAGPLLGAAVAEVVTAAPWLSRPWRRTAWITVWLAAVAQLLTGISSPLEVVLAFAAGITVGAGVLVLFGVPDRRIGPDEIAAALSSAGLPVSNAASLRLVARRPGKVIMLVGGSALITLAYIGALVASVEAFGGGPGFALIGAVYLGAAALASVAPTPGGLGAIEAALVAGLAGAGMSSGLAVSAVLLYRLATYWLPVAPGWVSLRLLQRWDYV